ncbi:MAG: hypothetical protein WA364_12230 [Candidatus Nitrosopolaris sp.]
MTDILGLLGVEYANMMLNDSINVNGYIIRLSKKPGGTTKGQ